MYTNPEAVENAKQEYNKNFKSFTPSQAILHLIYDFVKWILFF